MPRFSFRLALVVCVALATLACERHRAPSQEAGAQDDFGLLIDTTGTPKQRIVSLNPTTTELLFALGAGSSVVGRSEWDQWPVEARALPSVGPGLRPNVETVLAHRPDLVVLYGSADNRAAADRLGAAGIPVLALKIDRIAHFVRATRMLGALSGQQVRADSIVRAVTFTLDSVRSATSALPRPRVFWHIWNQPLITIGGGSFLNELLEIAGAENVYAEFPAVSPPVSLEDVVRRDPDFILVGPVNSVELRRDPRWQAVRAMREGGMAVVDTNLVGRPSVMLGAAATHLAQLLHPAEPTP